MVCNVLRYKPCRRTKSFLAQDEISFGLLVLTELCVESSWRRDPLGEGRAQGGWFAGLRRAAACVEHRAMRWLKPLFFAGESLVDRILCVVGAVFFAQTPEFMQQYLQRIGGHLAEARRQLAQFEGIARQTGKTVQELAVQYSANADPAVVSMGKLVNDSELRVSTLASAEAAIRDASVWERPFVFLRQLDWEIARGTGSVYKPAVPTTIEGLLYGLIGVVLILGLYYGLLRPLTLRLLGASKAVKPEAKVV